MRASTRPERLLSLALVGVLSYGAVHLYDEHREPLSVTLPSLSAYGEPLERAIALSTAYSEGQDDGVADYCQEVGGDGSEHGTCVLPDPPVRDVVRYVEVPTDTLQCPDGFVAWDQRKGGGEWAYCEDGDRPDGAR